MATEFLHKLLVFFTLLNTIDMPDGVESAGQKLVLNEKEQLVDFYIQDLKDDTLSEVSTSNLYKSDIYRCKEKVEQSELFKVFKKMPKAASLDGHLFGLISHEYLYNLTYISSLFVRVTGDTIKFSYSSSNSSDWQHLRTLRKKGKISERLIKQQFSFESVDFANVTAYNNKLVHIFNTVKTLLSKISVLRAAIYRMLKQFYDDKVMYVEFRYSLDFYDSKIRKKYLPVQVLWLCNKVIKRFKRNHHGFFGAKIIYSPANQKKFDENLANLLQMARYYPKILVGFDVKLNEADFGRVMSELKKIPIAIQIFLIFNKDVTFKNGTNLNLINSMVNRPSRYMYNNRLLKNEQFYKHIKGLGVGVSVSPLSLVRTNVFKLHSSPTVQYIKDGYRIVIGNEYPSFLRSTGSSLDWYMFFVLMADSEVELSFLKHTALNSLIYSGLSELDAMTAISMWTQMWYVFIEDMQKFNKSNLLNHY